jgi:acyl carrier protein
MNREEIIRHLQIALSIVLNREVTGLEPETRLFEDLAMDSTSIIELLMSLEDTMSLEIDPDELSADVFRTVGSLTGYLQDQFARVASA